MSGDQRRDRPKQDARSRSYSPQRELPQPRELPQRDAIASGDRERPRAGESEPPTRPRGRTITDSELPADSRPSVNVPAFRAMQDSIHPVRVPARTVRPPLSLWTRAWATMALVIVVAGGAIGIVTCLRARTLAVDRNERDDRSPAASGVPSAAAPAAAPVVAAPPPSAPSSSASRSLASSANAGEAPAN